MKRPVIDVKRLTDPEERRFTIDNGAQLLEGYAVSSDRQGWLPEGEWLRVDLRPLTSNTVLVLAGDGPHEVLTIKVNGHARIIISEFAQGVTIVDNRPTASEEHADAV